MRRLVAAASCASACMQPRATTCGDRVCEVGDTCTASGCASSLDVEACTSLAAGAPCNSLVTSGRAVCQSGACLPAVWNASATTTALGQPAGLAIDAAGDLYVADAGHHQIARIDASGASTIIAGTGAACPAATLACGDGGAATSAQLASPRGVAIDELGNVYVADSGDNRIRWIDAAGQIHALAGDGTFGFAGDAGMPASAARFRAPAGMFFDAAASALYVADAGNHVVRIIDLSREAASATITTFAGTPAMLGFAGDGMPSTSAALYLPGAVARCPSGDVFIADSGNNRIRRVDTAGTISTVIGDGTPVSSGDDGPAQLFSIDQPLGVACDPVGNLAATSTTVVRLVAADANATVDGTRDVQSIYGAAPRDAYPASATSCLAGIAFRSATDVDVVDTCTGLLVELRRESAP